MMSNDRCWRRRLAVLAIATSLLSGCATGGYDLLSGAVCPPVVDYTPEFQARAAKEVVLLPDRSAIAAMLADYSVMRDQARACRGR